VSGKRARLTAAVSTEPQRTCVGCRRRADRSVLLRVTADEVDGLWSVNPDPGRRRPGRGAWLHLDPRCLDVAERRTAFPRALRRSGPLDPAPLRQYVNEHHLTAVPPSEPEAGLKSMSTR